MTKFTVGQKLWFVPIQKYNGQPREVLVEKVGRKWVTLNGRVGRFDPKTMRVDGGGYSSPGDVYLTRQEWEERRVLALAWRDFRLIVNAMYSAPAGMTRDKLDQLFALIGAKAPEESA